MSEQPPDKEPQPQPPRCVACGRLQDARFRPFCSKRCADIDLGRWLKGTYVIASDEPPDRETDESGAEEEH
jgi:uncharacterized protein